MATLTVLFAKATVNLLSLSLFQQSNQFIYPSSWLLTIVTIITAVSQIYWINMGLARYDALLQIPVFYVVWTLFDVIGGGVYYGEFDGFSPVRVSFN
jgi:Magnesium transporter NIPA